MQFVRRIGLPLFFASALSVLVCSRSFLIGLSKKSGDSSYKFDPSAVVLLTEVVKLCIASCLLFTEASQKNESLVEKVRREFDPNVAGLYAIPALMYAAQNNLVFYCLLFLAPPTFELFTNMKIVTTAIVFRIWMAKKLTRIQWAGIILLTMGTAIGQLGIRHAEEAKAFEEERALTRARLQTPFMTGPPGALPGNDGQPQAFLQTEMSLSRRDEERLDDLSDDAAENDLFEDEDDAAVDGLTFGFILCIIYATISAVAGIFTEKMLKGSRQSTHLQNIEIYFWSVIVNFLIGSYKRGGQIFPENGFTHGFTSLTWAIILISGLMGQCVSFVMKFANNIVKVFAACIALFLSTFVSTLFTDFTPNILLFLGFGNVCVAMFLYFGGHNAVVQAAEEQANGGSKV